jgi:hypothetical protein
MLQRESLHDLGSLAERLAGDTGQTLDADGSAALQAAGNPLLTMREVELGCPIRPVGEGHRVTAQDLLQRANNNVPDQCQRCLGSGSVTSGDERTIIFQGDTAVLPAQLNQTQCFAAGGRRADTRTIYLVVDPNL